MTSNPLMRGTLSDKGAVFGKCHGEGRLWYPAEMVTILVAAEDNRSLNMNDGIFKPFYPPPPRFCKINIWLHYVYSSRL